MARSRSVLLLVAGALALMGSLPAFAGLKAATRVRDSRVAMGDGWVHKGVTQNQIELVITFSDVGARTRYLCNPYEVTADEVIAYGRKQAGFDQDWIPASDFHVFWRDDESIEMKGKLFDSGLLRDYDSEVHVRFLPAV